jgi:hypothetical protein
MQKLTNTEKQIRNMPSEPTTERQKAQTIKNEMAWCHQHKQRAYA